jgi:hypothetical protein
LLEHSAPFIQISGMGRARIALVLTALLTLWEGCATAGLRSIVTRTEKELYTHTRHDTTTTIEYPNAPGERGIMYPSNRSIVTQRKLEQYDSTTERRYPNFIRFAAFETAGLIATGPSDKAVSGGIFGIFFDPNETFSTRIAPKSSLFTGMLSRVATIELPLYWMDETPTWSIGTSLVELFQLEATNDRAIAGVFPVYLRKRYFLRDAIPYVTVTGAIGLGFAPSQYLNLAISLDAGSLGGLNLRALAGLVLGRSIEEKTVTQPYLGLGVSVLDFHNHPRELRTEWSHHEHSSWNIGLARFEPFLLLSGGDTLSSSSRFGFQLQIAPATIALPVGDHRICAGVDLFNFVVAYRQEQARRNQDSPIGFGYGVLPVRLGYWLPIGRGAVAVEPFVMASYFPHTMWQVAARVHLGALDWLPLGITLGYISSSGLQIRSGTLADLVGTNVLAFNVAYIGISIGIAEEMFRPEQLRYYRSATQ